jgi:hypothetical protein
MTGIDEQKIEPVLGVAGFSVRPTVSRDALRIQFDLLFPQRVNVMVYDAAGRAVKKLASGHHRSGRYSLIWDGKSEHSPAGVYFVRLQADGVSRAEKVILTAQ